MGGVTLGYDKAGNLTQGRTGSFTYDAENKLTRAVMGASNPQGALTALYNYDSNGRRTQKTVTPSGGSSTTTDYLSDGDHEVAEYPANSATPLKRFIYGKNVDEIIAQHEPATSSYSYAHRNHQGSVIAVSNSTGQVNSTSIYTYSPYGEPNISTGFPYRYTGRRLDVETGLYYYRARYYDAQLGRFLQVDPVGYEDQMNLYAYVGSDPVNKVDPTGKFVFLIAVPFIEGLTIGFTTTQLVVGTAAGTAIAATAIAVKNEAADSDAGGKSSGAGTGTAEEMDGVVSGLRDGARPQGSKGVWDLPEGKGVDFDDMPGEEKTSKDGSKTKTTSEGGSVHQHTSTTTGQKTTVIVRPKGSSGGQFQKYRENPAKE